LLYRHHRWLLFIPRAKFNQLKIRSRGESNSWYKNNHWLYITSK
jgi:hypothetical protein